MNHNTQNDHADMVHESLYIIWFMKHLPLGNYLILHYTILGQSYTISVSQQPAFGGDIYYIYKVITNTDN